MHARVRPALEAPGADLSHARVVEHLHVPGGFEPGARARDTRPRLPGVDADADRGRAEVNTHLPRGLRHAQRVRGRAEQHGCLEVEDLLDALLGSLPPARDTHCPHELGTLEPRPEADEWPEGERREHAVRGPDTRRTVDVSPTP